LDEKGRRKILISIMAEETTEDATGKEVKTGFLKVDPVPTGSGLDASLRLRVSDSANPKFQGEGAAGTAFCLQSPVYIPKVFYQVGIRLDKVKSLGPTYAKSRDAKPLRSILSVPVLVADKPPAVAPGSPMPATVIRSVAVINAASLRSHAFTRDDVRILELVAVYVSTLY
jgi:GAF domain-containing protein